MGRRQRDWARRKREELIAALGGKCVICGETDEEKLQFDHINGDRDWIAKETELSWRMSIYQREAEEGKIQLLCSICNQRKGTNEVHTTSPDDPDWEV